ncbi:hypothetical protein CL659_04695 [bacterium]|nr:hypothetical protein [bacterium]|tara:strand:- start:4406 stop:5116 length:711 start_codon:yes stop_codon:yes gene_type:complete
MDLKKVFFLDREIVISNKEQIIEFISSCSKQNRNLKVFTLNPETWLKTKDLDFGDDVLWIPESIAVYYAMIFLGVKARRLPGIDLVSSLLKENFFNVICWGGNDQDCKSLKNNWVYLNFNSKIIEAFDGFSENQKEVIGLISKTKKAIVLVGKGAGLQEREIMQIATKKTSCVYFGVGGALDVFSMKKTRAPLIMVKFGFEFLWRIFFEPRRLIRIINCYPAFFSKVLRSKFCTKK